MSVLTLSLMSLSTVGDWASTSTTTVDVCLTRPLLGLTMHSEMWKDPPRASIRSSTLLISPDTHTHDTGQTRK